MPDVIAQWRHYLSVLSPRAGDAILDIGCNTGDTERLLLRDHPDVARVVGIDSDPARVARARERCRDDVVTAELAFQEADAQALPFTDGSFGKVLCVETLEYVADPIRALREMRRVLGPDGAALIVHTDWDTQLFGAADHELSRRITLAFSEAGPNGQIGRRLRALCRRSGYTHVTASVYVLLGESFGAGTYPRRR